MIDVDSLRAFGAPGFVTRHASGAEGGNRGGCGCGECGTSARRSFDTVLLGGDAIAPTMRRRGVRVHRGGETNYRSRCSDDADTCGYPGFPDCCEGAGVGGETITVYGSLDDDGGGQFDVERGDEFFPDFVLPPPTDLPPPSGPRDDDDDEDDEDDCKDMKRSLESLCRQQDVKQWHREYHGGLWAAANDRGDSVGAAYHSERLLELATEVKALDDQITAAKAAYGEDCGEAFECPPSNMVAPFDIPDIIEDILFPPNLA